MIDHEAMKKNKRFYLFLSLFTLVTGILLVFIANTKKDGILRVRFIDVGQADACLISLDSEWILIDGGNREDSSLIYSVLKNEGVSNLKALINTHPDEDHIGGLTAAFSACSVDAVFCSVNEYESGLFDDFREKTIKSGNVITVPKAGDVLKLAGAELTFLNAPGEFEDVNGNSLIIRLDFKNNSFLFMADSGREQEEMLLENGVKVEANVLKVAHHGSEKSSSLGFLHDVRPDFAVISVGKRNTYGLPKKNTLNRLSEAGSKIFRTDLMGNICFQSDGYMLTYSSDKKYNLATSVKGGTWEAADIIPDDARYIGNAKSMKYHTLSCNALPGKENRVYFSDREAAEVSGYVPCGKCRPQ